MPSDWSRNIVRGKGYDLTEGPGRRLWEQVREALSGIELQPEIREPMVAGSERFGSPVVHRPRLGQGSFRVMVTDAYRRRCAVTRERVLRRMKEEYENGREYYRLHGSQIVVPDRPDLAPSSEFLQWHNQSVYRP